MRHEGQFRTALRAAVRTLPIPVLAGPLVWMPGRVLAHGAQPTEIAGVAAATAIVPVVVGLLAVWGVSAPLRGVRRLDVARRRPAFLAAAAFGLVGMLVADGAFLFTSYEDAGFPAAVLLCASPAAAFAVADGGDVRLFLARLGVGALTLPIGFFAGFFGGVAGYAAVGGTPLEDVLVFPCALAVAHLVITTAVAATGRGNAPAVDLEQAA